MIGLELHIYTYIHSSLQFRCLLKVTFVLFALLVGIAFAEDPYAKFDHLLKDGKITEEYLTELANEMIKDSKESVKSLSGSYKDEESLIRNYGNINKSLLNWLIER